MRRSQNFCTTANAKAPALFGRQNVPENRSILARSGEPHPLPGHKVPNHLRQDQSKKNRSNPLSKELYEEIIALNGFRFFTDSYLQFMSVMEKTSIVLPLRQYRRSAPYVRSALYDVGRQYSRIAAHTWSPLYQNDYALCASCASTL